MAATNSLGGPKLLLWTVRGDHMFCHGQSGGNIFWWDQVKYDRPRTMRQDFEGGVYEICGDISRAAGFRGAAKFRGNTVPVTCRLYRVG